LTSYHFWCRVARTPAGCLQSLAVFISIRETKINYFDVLVLI
jgi:hypothetical protein